MTTIRRLLRQHGKLINRTQDGPPDAYGDPTWVETVIDLDPSDPDGPGGVSVQPVASEELADLPDGRIRYRAWLSVDVDVSGASRIELVGSGMGAEVIGPPRVWSDVRTARPHHIVLDLSEVAPITGGSS